MSDDRNATVNREYWEKNIGAFSGFYDRTSEETLMAPGWLAFFYRKLLFPIEKHYMGHRFALVSDFIARQVSPGMLVADVGCGSGIFIGPILLRGARALALDYAQSAVDLVRSQLSEVAAKSVHVSLFDITRESIPEVDVAISIGVLTYITDLDGYLDHILPHTRKFLFNFIDADNLLNRLRRLVPLLDVRRLSYHSRPVVERAVQQRGFAITRATRLASGWVVEAESTRAAGAGGGRDPSVSLPG